LKKTDRIPRNLALLIITLTFALLFIGPDYFALWGSLSKTHYFGHDFACYYNAVKMIAAGNLDYYDWEKFRSSAEALGLKGVCASNYPPFAFVVMFPFASLSFHAAMTAAFIINHLLLLLSMVLLYLSFCNDSRHLWRDMLWIVPSALVFSPVIDTLYAGQIDILILFLLSLSIFLMVKNAENWAALALAVAINIKVAPVLFLLYFAAKGKWRTFALTLGLTAAAALLPLLLWGKETYLAFFQNHDRILYIPNAPANQSLAAFFCRIFAGGVSSGPAGSPPIIATIAPAALSLVLVLGLYLACRTSGDRKIESLQISLVTATIFPLSTFSWPHHHLWILIAFMALLFFVREESSAIYPVLLSYFLLSTFDGEVSCRTGIIFYKQILLYFSAPLFSILVVWLTLYLLIRSGVKASLQEGQKDDHDTAIALS
jgi:hypothetical protein